MIVIVSTKSLVYIRVGNDNNSLDKYGNCVTLCHIYIQVSAYTQEFFNIVHKFKIKWRRKKVSKKELNEPFEL